jgi:hypothetical protein
MAAALSAANPFNSVSKESISDLVVAIIIAKKYNNAIGDWKQIR